MALFYKIKVFQGMKIRKNIEFMGNNCLAMIALAFYNSKANFWEEIYNG